MKMGFRTPSIKKSVSARTTGAVKRSVKRSINPTYGKSGMGYINNPKKAVYNKVYNQTTSSVFSGSSSSYSSGDLSSLTVVQLKEILRANGLKVSGTKQELINRIVAAGISVPISETISYEDSPSDSSTSASGCVTAIAIIYCLPILLVGMLFASIGFSGLAFIAFIVFISVILICYFCSKNEQ